MEVLFLSDYKIELFINSYEMEYFIIGFSRLGRF